MPGGEAPKLEDLMRDWIFETYGFYGLMAVFVLFAVFWARTHWRDVTGWPGVSGIVAFLSRKPPPKADPGRFAVAVMHLEDDLNRENERLIIEALKEFGGVQVLALGRTISLEGPVPEEREKEGHKRARQYLQRTGGSVAIWGAVLGHPGGSIPKLYWTMSPESERRPGRYQLAEKLQLPELFWSDLGDILRLLIVTNDAEFRAKQGWYIADTLPPFIARVRHLLDASKDRPEWDVDTRGRTRLIPADALQVLGDQTGKTEPLEEAVAAYRAALEERTRARAPLDWAMTQNNLGTALATLGERESDINRLQEALDATQVAFDLYMEVGYQQYRDDFESKIQAIKNRMAELRESGRSARAR